MPEPRTVQLPPGSALLLFAESPDPTDLRIQRGSVETCGKVVASGPLGEPADAILNTVGGAVLELTTRHLWSVIAAPQFEQLRELSRRSFRQATLFISESPLVLRTFLNYYTRYHRTTRFHLLDLDCSRGDFSEVGTVGYADGNVYALDRRTSAPRRDQVLQSVIRDARGLTDPIFINSFSCKASADYRPLDGLIQGMQCGQVVVSGDDRCYFTQKKKWTKPVFIKIEEFPRLKLGVGSPSLEPGGHRVELDVKGVVRGARYPPESCLPIGYTRLMKPVYVDGGEEVVAGQVYFVSRSNRDPLAEALPVVGKVRSHGPRQAFTLLTGSAPPGTPVYLLE